MGGFLRGPDHDPLVPLEDLRELLGELSTDGVMEVDAGRLPHLALHGKAY